MRILSLLLLVLGLWSCSSEQMGDKPSYEGVTADGFKFNIYSSTKSDQITEPGKYIYFTSAVLLDDTMNLQPKSEVIRMLVPTDSALMVTPNPVIDVLSRMVPGDSANVYIELDSIPQAKMQFPNNKFVNNYFIVEDIVDEDQYLDDIAKEKEEAMKMMKESQAKEGEVATTIEDLLGKYKKGELDGSLEKLESGLQIYNIEEGIGEALGNGNAKVHYYGVLESDGSEFDNSFKRGTPFSFNVGAGMVIPGWDEGVAKLKEGSKSLLFIPSELGYGETGSGQAIPPNSNLVFYIEVLK
ncbi:FKBP-type peptidyl-prolyl cis-trans isomerase [Membranihabitans marinus]|uniref:FKBP-type peptidyl-prolyl cis-trans isomerase n=1 Tax=Membranihabitans marinus TaxID=1227546 RepID=UPI001F00723B|nr:FKBP-type peptidyl-prolyl cis-trans isomerase [Membranihabitans marinus]